MLIKIRKDNNPPEILKRKSKIQKLFKSKKENIDIPLKYDWDLTTENEYESLEDLHLFCISITKDLLIDTFKTNEHGSLTYDLSEFNEEERKFLIKSIKHLFNKIAIIKHKKKRNVIK